MTDPQYGDRFDREIRDFLAWEAKDIAGVKTVSEMAASIGQGGATRAFVPRMSPGFAWAILAGLLAVALLGAALAGVGRRHDGPSIVVAPPDGAQSAVFLRLDPDDDLVVSSVSHTVHRQHDLLRLPDGRLGNGGSPSHPVGAVSRNGLLAVTRPIAGQYRWEIVDLWDPQAAAIVVPGIQQDVEPFLRPTPFVGTDSRGGAFWGPRDQLAIIWYEHVPRNSDSMSPLDIDVTFVDGRTGESHSVDLPDGLGILPHWTTDGSGVVVTTGGVYPTFGILRTDGTVSEGLPPRVVSFCQDPDPSAPLTSPALHAEEFACISPDRRLTYRSSGPFDIYPTDNQAFAVDGKWAGWMEID